MNFVYFKSNASSNAHLVTTINSVIHNSKKIELNNNEQLYIDLRNESDCFVENANTIGYVSGYIRDYKLPPEAMTQEHNQVAINETSERHWPLDNAFGGSFSIFSYNKQNSLITICNDPIGIYPLYYYLTPDTTIISSSLILMGLLSNNEIDDIGVVEKMLGGEYCNFGKRTIIKDVFRLLPGELISFTDINDIKTVYDNTLYQNISKDSIPDTSTRVWKTIKDEFDLCLKPYDHLGIATSGGLDSRVLLGAVDQTKNIHCMTYDGNADDYETKIAKACAETIGASFNSYSIYDTQFPSKSLFSQYILETEATGIQAWLSIIENDKVLANDSVMLIGDICDMLTAKHIKKYRSRSAKIKTFFKYLLWNKEQPFTLNTETKFKDWKDSIQLAFIHQIQSLYLKTPPVQTDMQTVIDGVINDLNDTFQRIEAHHILYFELLDEIFALYTHGRIAMAKQLLINKKRFFPLAPILSMKIAREATAVYPTRKLNFKLLDYMFREEHDLQALAMIPTAQVPYIPYRSNNLLKLLIWGARSTLDQLLIKRQVRKKDAHIKHRVLKSINWVKAYQTPHAAENLASWFDTDYIHKKADCLDTLNKRANFEAWPLMPSELIALGTLNLEITMIKEMQKNLTNN